MPVHIPSYSYAAFSHSPNGASKWTTNSVHQALPDITTKSFEEGLALLGEYGWEFVGTAPRGSLGQKLIFKRPGQAPARSGPAGE